MIVQKKVSDDYTVIGAEGRLSGLVNGLRPALDHIIMKYLKSKTLFSTSYLPFSSIVDKVNDLNPDIIHLHWIAGGTKFGKFNGEDKYKTSESERLIRLPMYYELDENSVIKVVNIIKTFFKE